MASFNTMLDFVGSDSHGCSSWVQTCQHCEADETGASRQGSGPYKLCQQVYWKQSTNRNFEDNLYCKWKGYIGICINFLGWFDKIKLNNCKFMII